MMEGCEGGESEGLEVCRAVNDRETIEKFNFKLAENAKIS